MPLPGAILAPDGSAGIWGHGDIRAWTDAEDHVWVHGPTMDRVCINVQWPMVPLKATGITKFLASTWDHIDV